MVPKASTTQLLPSPDLFSSLPFFSARPPGAGSIASSIEGLKVGAHGKVMGIKIGQEEYKVKTVVKLADFLTEASLFTDYAAKSTPSRIGTILAIGRASYPSSEYTKYYGEHCVRENIEFSAVSFICPKFTISKFLQMLLEAQEETYLDYILRTEPQNRTVALLTGCIGALAYNSARYGILNLNCIFTCC